MKNWRSLVALTVACAFAAALYGVGTQVFAFRGFYEEQVGRMDLILVSRLFVYLALALVLVFRGGWWGVPAAVLMAATATTVEWLLYPFALDFAAVADPAGYAQRFGDARPSYARFGALYDILGVGIASVLAAGLRMMAHAAPTGTRDE